MTSRIISKKKKQQQHGVTDHFKKISEEEITWCKNLKIVLSHNMTKCRITWQTSVLQQRKDKKQTNKQLNHAIKP